MSQYASASDFYDLSGLTQERCENGRKPVYPDTLDVFLRAAAEVIDSAIAIKYHGAVPLRAWGDQVRLVNVQLAAHPVALRIGLSPADPTGELKMITDATLLAQGWLKGIREGTIFLAGFDTVAPKTDYRGASFAAPDDSALTGCCPKGGRTNFWGH